MSAPTSGTDFRVCLVLSTYNQPQHLERVLWGYARQTWRDFDLIVADDGSGPATRAIVQRVQAETSIRLTHLWQEDRGFRKTRILNQAILAAAGDYLIFSDGDCIPREDFIATHRELAVPGRFLSGGALKIPQAVTDQITVDDVRSGRATDLAWLLEKGWKPPIRHRLRLTRSRSLAATLDVLTPTAATWNGNNASCWRRHLIHVNGMDLDMGYGAEDRALGARLENAGIRGVGVRFRAPLVHLAHPQPYKDMKTVQENRRIVKQLQKTGRVRAERGLEELELEQAR